MKTGVTEAINSLIEEGTLRHTSPPRLADILGELSGWYSYLTDQFDALEKPYNEEWMTIREKEAVKSDTKADRMMDMSETGILRKRLRHRMKAIEKVMSSIKSRLKVKEGEYYNQV